MKHKFPRRLRRKKIAIARPGDILILQTAQKLDYKTIAHIGESMRAYGIKAIVLDGGITLSAIQKESEVKKA